MSSDKAINVNQIIQFLGDELEPLRNAPGDFYARFFSICEQELNATAGVVFLMIQGTLTPMADFQFLESGIAEEENEATGQRNLELLTEMFLSAETRFEEDLFAEATSLPTWQHALYLPLPTQRGMVELVFPAEYPKEMGTRETRFELKRLISLPFIPPTSPATTPPPSATPQPPPTQGTPNPVPPHQPTQAQPTASPQPVQKLPTVIPQQGSQQQTVQQGSPTATPNQTPAPALTVAFRDEVIAYSQALTRSLRVREVAGTAVNQIARILRADRVTVIVQRGKKFYVLESSGQEKVHARANLVQSLKKLVRVVLPRRKVFSYPQDAAELSASHEVLLSEFVQQAQSAMFLVVPLYQPAPLLHPEDTGEEPMLIEPERKIRGVLVVEIGRVYPAGPNWKAETEILAAQLEGPIANAERHQRLPMRPVWTFLGEIQDWMQGRRLLKVGLVLGILTLLIASLFIFPWTYNVSGSGELLPVKQRFVFAPFDGKVQKVKTDTGAKVKENDELVELVNDGLETEWLELSNQRQLKVAQLEVLRERSKVIQRTGTREEQTQVQGEIEVAQIEVAGLKEQLDVLDERRAESIVLAPQAGVVTTFQPKQLLQGRAISRGEILLELMDDSVGWRLELKIEEGRIGHLLAAIEAKKTKSLPVEFFIATEPETTYEGTLKLLAVRPQASQEEGSVIEVFVEVPEDQNFHRRIGAAVKARIDCGNKSLGYVLFGDFIEFFQRRFWL